jgi:NADH:ubiquinone oxidoreductase subunit 4 (subunit M)
LPFANTLCVLGIVYASLTTLRQIDLKRIIAYSSVAHMSYGMLGIFSLNYYGIIGSILLMLGHGLVSSALFYIVGIIYEIYGTRVIFYYGGLGQIMPIFSFFFLFFVFANAGLPGLGIFPGELLVAIGAFSINPLGIVVSVFAGVFTVAYMVLLYNRVVFGTVKIQYYDSNTNPSLRDLNKIEFLILIIFSYSTLVFGLCPQIFINVIEPSVLGNLNLYKYKY